MQPAVAIISGAIHKLFGNVVMSNQDVAYYVKYPHAEFNWHGREPANRPDKRRASSLQFRYLLSAAAARIKPSGNLIDCDLAGDAPERCVAPPWRYAGGRQERRGARMLHHQLRGEDFARYRKPLHPRRDIHGLDNRACRRA